MGISSRTTEILRLSEKNEGLKSTNDFLVKQLERRVNQLRDYRTALEEMREIADLIVNDEDKPSCVNDDDCPLNNGEGLDNHCDLNCPYILGKHIQTKISEVLK